MDDLTEREQLDAIKKWWNENGKAIIAGLAVGLSAVFGWQYWQKWQDQTAEEASAQEREFNAARRYTGARVSRSTARSTRSGSTFGEAMTKMVVKELTGTTGRRMVRGILGGLFKGR